MVRRKYKVYANIGFSKRSNTQFKTIIDLVVDIFRSVVTIRFNVVERLGTKVIIRFDYCDEYVETIPPRKVL